MPVLERLPQVGPLLAAKSWFVVHAPRQSGKTTLLRTLAHELTAPGKYAALHASCETGSPYPDDPAAASRAILGDMVMNANIHLPQMLRPPQPEPSGTGERMISVYLQAWATTCPLPTVLLLDEIDSLQDAALISVLRQLRSPYLNRPDNAPSSVAMVGVRDVRDYKAKVEPGGRVGSDSPFNVTVKSLTLKAFTRDEIATLYGQHTTETGQAFTAAAVDLVHEYTQGQPWLVNALAWHVITESGVVGTITDQHIMRAKEEMILSRTAHLLSLAKLLRDPRVRAVVIPMLTGEHAETACTHEDIAFCIDLGIITQPRGQAMRIANPIYREVLPRELAYVTQASMPDTDRMVARRKWALPDGRLDIAGLLDAFVDFWRQHGEWMIVGQEWPEAAHQIVLMAWLHRVVNGGGYPRSPALSASLRHCLASLAAAYQSTPRSFSSLFLDLHLKSGPAGDFCGEFGLHGARVRAGARAVDSGRDADRKGRDGPDGLVLSARPRRRLWSDCGRSHTRPKSDIRRHDKSLTLLLNLGGADGT